MGVTVHLIKPLEDNELLSQCIAIRKEVFIEEQKVAYEIEQDGLDGHSYHILLEENGKYVATMRMHPQGTSIKFGRIAVVKARRFQGLGSYIVKEALKLFPHSMIYLHAQENAVPFYLSLGFIPTDERTIEAGISHITMKYVT
jgi:predicted GNAT family N-acyltransferase